MQHISLRNEDMQKALEHLNKLIVLEGLEQEASQQLSQQQQYQSEEYSSNQFHKENGHLGEKINNNSYRNGDYNMNGQYIIQDDREQNERGEYNNNQLKSNKYNPNSNIPYQYHQMEQKLHNFQSISSVAREEQSIQNRNESIDASYPDSIQQSQTDTEYLEQIKQLVVGRQSDISYNPNNQEKENEMSRENYEDQIKWKQQDRNQYSSSSSSSENEDNDNDMEHQMKQYQQILPKNYTPKEIQDISERLFQDGKIRQQKNSLKKIETQLEQCYRSKDERQVIMNNQTKRIIEKKIQNGEYEPIHKRWNTCLQAKAEKMLEAKAKKEYIQQQMDKKDLTFKPEVNQHSQQMVQKRTQEQVVNALHTWNKRKLDKLFNSQFRENEKAVQNLTFHPKINNPTAKQIGKNESEDVVKRLYKKMEEVETKKELLKQEEFNSKHTFKPKVNEKSIQIVQEAHIQERSLTPIYGSRYGNKRENENMNQRQNGRSKTPTNHHSYSRSITPQTKGKRSSLATSHSQFQQNHNNNKFESNSKENHFNLVSDSTSNGRLSQMFDSQYQSQRGSISQKSQANFKKTEHIIDQSLNLIQQEHHFRNYSKDDRILQQNNEKLNTLMFSPQRSEGNSILRNFYSPSINSSFNAQQEIKHLKYQNNPDQKKSTNYQMQSVQNQSQNELKFNQTVNQPKQNSNNKQRSSFSKSPNSRIISPQQTYPSKNNFISSSSQKEYQISSKKIQPHKIELTPSNTPHTNNYVCCPNNPHVNVQEIEFNKKLQFLLDLLSSEEKRKYQSNALDQDCINQSN